jgi:4-hydroxy-tetrahydrodipicolinate reductase
LFSNKEDLASFLEGVVMANRIGIAGIAGRMGQLLAEEAAAAGFDVVGGVDRAAAPGAVMFADIKALAAASDVVVDFTHASTAVAHAAAVAGAGCAWVLGTTGLDAAQEAAVAAAGGRTAVVYAPNYSPGVVLLTALAEQLGAALPAETYDAEIVEMHHRQKVDAPSGTAVALGRAVARGRGVKLEEVTESGRDGHTGARKTGDIGFATLRGGTVVGEHTVIFAGPDERIELTHKAADRALFARGALHAALWARKQKPGLYSMMDVLGLKDF